MKRIILIVSSILLVGHVSYAQTRWINPFDEGAQLQGQGWESLDGTYFRLPDDARKSVRKPLWNLSRNSSGLSFAFRSNASDITVRYAVSSKSFGMFHMPPTGVSGVDLYATDIEGRELWCAPKFPLEFKDTINYIYNGLTYQPRNKGCYEYRLYLPLYNTVEWMEIGVPEGAEIEFHKRSLERPIVVYGTSIAQGACASRPGLAWVNILQRRTGHPFVNLGFSGNGRMEEELFNLLDQIDARMYIIDCVPNLSLKMPIVERTVKGIKMLRKHHDCPILLVEHSGNPQELSSVDKFHHRELDAELRKAYKQLVEAGMKDIYYMSHEEFGFGLDEMVEGVHPNDAGMLHNAQAYLLKINAILGEEEREFHACVQNRDNYDWYARHQEVLKLKNERKPEIVLIGDSITHFWGGDPQYSNRGIDSWNNLWKGKNVLNLGYGWDRIENVLWRVRHDELDGYEAKTIVMMIGTNNLGRDSNDRIVAGINELVDEIHARQPKARLYVCGILPRNGMESQVELINEMLRKCLHTDYATYIDMTSLMVGPDGKIIKEYFSDGLHPNAVGYEKFAEMLRKGMK